MEGLVQYWIRFPVVAAAAISAVVSCTVHSAAQSLEPVSVRMSWLPISYHAPFYLGLAKGYYRDVGLDMKIHDGKGSGATAQLIANNVDTFGVADSAVVARAISQGLPLKIVMGIFPKSDAALVFPTKNGIKLPAELKGKSLATCAGDAPLIILPAYLKTVNLTMNDVKIVTVDCGAKYTVVAQGLADVTIGYSAYARTMFGGAGITDLTDFSYADAGINLPSHGIVASLRTIDSKPDLIRRFAKATTKSWIEARDDPEAAIHQMATLVPLMKGKEDINIVEFKAYLQSLVSPGTRGRPFGWQSADEWKQAEEILIEYMGVKRQPSVNVYFTNEYVGQ
jgi:NitT/TauT family transport system substrate-binding protein